MIFFDPVNSETANTHSGIIRVFLRVTPCKNRYKFIVNTSHQEERGKGEEAESVGGGTRARVLYRESYEGGVNRVRDKGVEGVTRGQ